MKDNKTEILERNKIDSTYKWSIEDLYISKEAFESDFKKAKEFIQDIKNYQNTLNSKEKILECLKFRDEISKILDKLYTYSHMKFDEDSSIEESQIILSNVQWLFQSFEESIAFIEPELISLGEKFLNEISLDPDFEDYNFEIINLIRQIPHTLSQNEEKLLAKTSLLAFSPSNIYHHLTISDFEFPDAFDSNNKPYPVTQGTYSLYVHNKDRTLRESAYKSLFGTYKHHQNMLASNLDMSFKFLNFYSSARKYESSIDYSLFSDNVSKNFYKNLIDIVKSNLQPLHSYIKLKSKVLGLKKVRLFDLNVSLFDFEKDISYQDSIEIIINSLVPLGKEYIDLAQKAFSERWIDVYENKNKASGAYSTSCYDVHPYILLNYHGNLEDVFTLAHELGHAIHSALTNKNQPYPKSSYSIISAEIASITNEMLLLEYLIENTSDKNEKKFFLNKFLENTRTTLYRQIQFAEFEMKISDLIDNSQPLTAQNLNNIYDNLNKEYYGDLFETDEYSGVEWSRIPHFYSPFYVYKYATGFSCANYFAQRILNEDTASYIKFLKSGGSNFPLELLKSAGLDLESLEPVKFTIKKFIEKLREVSV
ncbi:oligoendopeptidase F [Thermodesulfobium narugense DSM 14796]|uniref:Oligopeptidase F n=1 Tax=Thermodesulfobium narugense DSM 14796 TaxID=747365 RepID=M1E9G0_9BACT|nr:oligoendopeptidase F [Thermodesulfobium narugense]AEE15214.1 oligoendopeptidase F [Thermodesulfobium narugense DSM 14796]